MSANKLVYLIEENVEDGKWLALQVHHYGYDVRGFPKLKGMIDAIQKARPDVIVMNMQFSSEAASGKEFLDWLRTRKDDVPVIFISSQDTIESRLEAVRAGGRAYFTKPVEVGELVDRIDTLTAPRHKESYRILIVDDDTATAGFHSKVLSEAGMETREVNNPLRVLDAMRDFNPELVLMDMYMPGCTGQELASLIRQQSAYVSIPIVFLSSETNLNVQMAAMGEGGDDFLTKPIDPRHLVASVSTRADRYRMLRSQMIRDGLTGLLNHANALTQLDFELARAIRQRTPLSFAMIDLDYFKAVNDKYGHPVGDLVLKSFSRLLKDRLRKTDIIARYGGEEFAVIMPDTTGVDAAGVLDNVRKIFCGIVQRGGKDEFSCSFSCGIAEYDPTGPQSQDICKKADDTLYLAKQEGRNRVELSIR